MWVQWVSVSAVSDLDTWTTINHTSQLVTTTRGCLQLPAPIAMLCLLQLLFPMFARTDNAKKTTTTTTLNDTTTKTWWKDNFECFLFTFQFYRREKYDWKNNDKSMNELEMVNPPTCRPTIVPEASINTRPIPILVDARKNDEWFWWMEIINYRNTSKSKLNCGCGEDARTTGFDGLPA